MGYLALYRKYRPVDFNSVYGQEEVVTVIKNAIVSGKVSHAYLFCGPRGTGKTTIAKIIARLVNCENLVDGNPCGKCYNCLNYLNSNDIVEIDAASNNGVDEIRELRDKINLVPSNSKYKVYIIDEVHMLTTQAFNALLKTLEEPPSHVIFILATTEPHKIPLTIASRCQKFRFSKIDDKKIVERLREISNLEDITIDDDALYEIARLSDGGMRDAINFLDQLVAYSNDNITIDDVYKVNGSVSYEELYTLLDDVKNNNKVKLIEFVDYLDESGKDINKFVEEMLIFLKDVILYKNANILSSISTKNDYIKLVSDKYNDKELKDIVKKYSVFARVNPSHKERIVFALQNSGKIVAMTGDGVNDAPALKNADIGIAMGKGGTDVAKNAADMILTDDDFVTIVDAVRQGRNIYDNIKKAVHFLIATNIGEIVTIFVGLLMGIKSPLLAIQLLWINLVTDSLPAIALGLEKEEENIMNRLPRSPKKSLFADGLWWKIIIEGSMLGMFTLLAFSIGNKLYSIEVGRTMAFLSLGILELVHSFNIKSEESIFKTGLLENKYLVGAFLLGTILQVIVVLIRPLATIFEVVPLNGIQWLYTILISFAPLAIIELQKAVNIVQLERPLLQKKRNCTKMYHE